MEMTGDAWRPRLACGHYGPILTREQLRSAEKLATRLTFCIKCQSHSTIEEFRETRGSGRRRNAKKPPASP